MTLTLTGAAVNDKIFPATAIVLVVGTIALGDCGVLLVVAGPVRTVAVAVAATVLYGSWKVRVDGTVSVFAI